MTADQYHAEVMQSLIMSRPGDKISARAAGDPGTLILKLIGPHALTPDETRNVLSIIHAAFDKPSAKNPAQTVLLLQTLDRATTDEPLHRQIAETIAWLQSR